MTPIKINKATLYNCDCMDYMATLPDNYFELAIVDPPYGIKEDGGKGRRNKSKYEKKNWDKATPDENYFIELFRVSENQIIWGANYFCKKLMPTMGWICWDKKLDNSDFSDFELAYSSFNRAAKIFRHSKNGGSRTIAALSDYIHPTQKPIKLYEWLLTNYAKAGDKILDTHGGSFSSAIACNNLGFEFVGMELDEDYYKASIERITNANKQIRMFE